MARLIRPDGLVDYDAANTEMHALAERRLAGEAEDMGQVIATSGQVTVPAGSFDDVIVTRDWTPLEPDTVEAKRQQGIRRAKERARPSQARIGPSQRDGARRQVCTRVHAHQPYRRCAVSLTR